MTGRTSFLLAVLSSAPRVTANNQTKSKMANPRGESYALRLRDPRRVPCCFLTKVVLFFNIRIRMHINAF